MKRIIILLFTLALIGLFPAYAAAMADSAECACVINGATGEVVFAKNEQTRHAMASTTKIMTAILALENSDADDVVTVTADAANQEGSAAYIEAGDKIKMRDLLYGLMLNSGNDAAYAVAEYITGSVDNFAERMNIKAEKLGLHDTHFANPSGLDAPDHYTTALDLAKLARYAMSNDDFREIVAERVYTATLPESGGTLTFSNHNKLLKTYEGATGIKTGYTKATGRCLVSSAKRDGMEFIAVTLNDPNDWADHDEMLDASFAAHYPKKVVEKGMKMKTARVNGKPCNMIAAEDFVVPFKEKGANKIEVITHLSQNIPSPLNAGEKVGYAEITANGEEIGRVDIVSETDITDTNDMRLSDSFMERVKRVIQKILM